MKKISLFLVTFSMLLYSCASLFNGKYQKVKFDTAANNEIYLDSVKMTSTDGKYRLQRNGLPKQICVRREGYIDAYYAPMQIKRSPLFYFNIPLFGHFMDGGKKAYNYQSKYTFECNRANMVKRMKDSKKIILTKITLNLNDDSYQSKLECNSIDKESFAFDNRIYQLGNKKLLQQMNFVPAMISVLTKFDYMDSINTSILGFNREDLFIEARVEKSNCTYFKSPAFFSFGGRVFTQTTIDWTVLNYYKEVLYTYRSTTTSGEIAYSAKTEKDWENCLFNSYRNAIEVGLHELIRTEKMTLLLQDHLDVISEREFTPIKLPKAKKYVSSTKEAISSSITISSEKGHGSGFLISEDGYIITNYHVVNDKSPFKVKLNNGNEFSAQIIRVSKTSDLALLKIESQNMIPFSINASHEIEIGANILAIGTPNSEDLSQTVSSGVISGVRESEGGQLIQTDAAINSGNSGGALIDENGKLIGIATSKLIGSGIEGIAFGIPAYEILDRLKIEMVN